MEMRKLGSQGLQVSAQGLGCAGASTILLSQDELAQIDQVAPKGIAVGERYADMRSVNR